MADVVYVIGQGETNEALRYSLRSLENIPHDRVWIAGFRPRWVAPEVTEIAVPQRGMKWENATANLLAACSAPDVSGTFVLFNDDFFVLEPLEQLPMFFRGTLREMLDEYHYTKSPYAEGLRAAAAVLGDGLSYELHVPMTLDKAKMRETLEFAGAQSDPRITAHRRTLYGNLWAVGGERLDDVKRFNTKSRPVTGPFASTNALSWAGSVGEQVRRMFPTRCVYERR